MFRAVAARFHADEKIREDKDFDSLMSREDFKKLLEERFPLQK